MTHGTDESLNLSGPGVRPLAVDVGRHAGRVAGALYLVCGLSVLQVGIVAPAVIDQQWAFLGVGACVVLLGVVTIGLAVLLSDQLLARLFGWAALVLIFGAAGLTSLGLLFANASRWNVGSLVYLLAPIFGFYLLRRPWAIAVVVADGVGYAVVLWFTDGVAVPGSQWFFLMAVLAATAVMVGGLADRADRLTRAEREARLELAASHTQLEARVADQVDQLARLERLRRFLSPPIADAVLSAGTNDILQPHRRRIGVLFCDLRGFTRFTATAEPEDVVELLEEYHESVVSVLGHHQASIGAFAGDGIMAYFGDPILVEEPARAALWAAQDLHGPMGRLLEVWRGRGFDLGYGIGIAYGYATLGMVGTESRCDYTPIGSVVNLAARLCDEARSAEIVLDHRAHAAVAGLVRAECCSLELKGFDGAVEAYRVAAPSPGGMVRPLRNVG